jgi:hypothetical protein
VVTGTALTTATTALTPAGLATYVGLLTAQSGADAALVTALANDAPFSATVDGLTTARATLDALIDSGSAASGVAEALGAEGTAVVATLAAAAPTQSFEVATAVAIDGLGIAIDDLGTAITDETTRATDAETALGEQITANAEISIASDLALLGLIDDETTRATDAETALGTRVTGETTRATGAETALGTRITGETSRATAAETALGGRIDSTNTRITILTEQVKNDIATATAVAVALGGNSFLPGKKFNLTVNVGSYDGESALAAQFGFMVNDSLAINGGVASGFGSGSSTAVRGGFTYGW